MAENKKVISQPKEDVSDCKTAKPENPEKVVEAEHRIKNIYEKLMEMRVDFTAAGIRKSGRNDYSRYDYYTLDDFLSICTKIAASHKVLILYSIDTEAAKLNLHNLENIEEILTFSMPLADAAIKGGSAIQNLGSQMTYTKRYLYMNVFEIAEPDMMDENLGRESEETSGSKDTDSRDANSRKKPQTAAEQEEERNAQEEADRVMKLPISPAKVATIRRLMEEIMVTEEQVCKVYKVAKIEDIREEQFKNVMASFEKTRIKNEAKKNAGTNQN